jgi:hypothetical protein
MLDACCSEAEIPSSAMIQADYRVPALFVKLHRRKRSDQIWTYEGLRGIIAISLK